MDKKDSSFSVIMTVYDDARKLEENLPVFLSQEYEPGYEVIVVDESSTDDTDDVLKQLKHDNPHLYTTFIPKPNRRITRRKLALSVGIKAAKNEWVIISDIDAVPKSSEWLKELAEATSYTTDAVVGYFMKKGLRLQVFEETFYARQLIRKEERKRGKKRQVKFMKKLRGRYDFVAVRREKAYDILKYFEQNVGRFQLPFIRLNIFLQALRS